MECKEVFELYAAAVGGGDVDAVVGAYADDAVFHDQGPTLSGRPPYHIVGKDKIKETLALIGSRGSKVNIKSIEGNVMTYELAIVTGHRLPCKGTLFMTDGLVKLHLVLPDGEVINP